MLSPHVQVLIDGTTLPAAIRRACERIHAHIEEVAFSSVPCRAGAHSLDARLVVTADMAGMTNGRLEHLLRWFDVDPCATLVLSMTASGHMDRADAVVGERAIDFVTSVPEADLAGRLTAMCGLSRPIAKLRVQVEQLRRRDERLSRTVEERDAELHLAATFQRDLLPRTLPHVRGADIHTLFHPAGIVSGDLYDVARLDDEHVAISLADATGHGLAAAMLVAYVKRLLCEPEAAGRHGAPYRPDEVLARVNEQICAAGLSECHFVAAIHAVYNEQSRVIRWARGGAPYPLLARPGRPPELVPSAGPLAGTAPSARYEMVEMRLEPGDRLIFYTDGVEALERRKPPSKVTDNARPEGWLRRLGENPLSRSLTDLETALDADDPSVREVDDVSIVAIELQRTPRLAKEAVPKKMRCPVNV